jgi:hypothetical protein
MGLQVLLLAVPVNTKHHQTHQADHSDYDEYDKSFSVFGYRHCFIENRLMNTLSFEYKAFGLIKTVFVVFGARNAENPIKTPTKTREI